MPEQLKDKQAFTSAVKNGAPTIVHFSAEWAEQCSQVDEVLDAISKQNASKNAKFYTCSAEELSEVSLQYKIEAVPTVLVFQSGKEVDRINGADAAKITEIVGKYSSEKGPEGASSLEERLKGLINKAKVMLFMKGDRKTPRCGFSKTIIEILKNTGVDYETFDILTDEEVRQGLKTYSDWPTYPQLYVKGELIGGLDIIKELQQSGELLETLQA